MNFEYPIRMLKAIEKNLIISFNSANKTPYEKRLIKKNLDETKGAIKLLNQKNWLSNQKRR